MGIFDIFSAQPGQQAAAAQTAADQQALQALTKQFGAGRGALTTDYAAALDPWTRQFTYAQEGQDALADALGLRGLAGNARAQQAFQNNPGYQFQLGQGLDAVTANAARLGQLNSGNTDIDLTKFAQGLAGTSWNDYVNRLQPFLSAGQGAAGGIAGVNTGLGNAMNQSYQGQGNAAYGTDVNIGKAEAAGLMSPYNASANLWGTGLALAGDVASVLGGKAAPAPKFS
jgi:hypothetical protein